MAIAKLLQSNLVIELNAAGERVAAKWFEETWTGEHGNNTNASAGYVGTNKSAGLESHWKYMRRDTIGSAGSNRRLSLAIFAPSLVKHGHQSKACR